MDVRNWTALDFETCPDRAVFGCASGALRVTTEGSVTINGSLGSYAYFPDRETVELLISGGTTLITEEGLPLSSLTVSELQEIVAWAGVETEAQTASGLKRAIERHHGL